MLPIKKIICPTDFSEPSYEAIKTAGELAFHFGSELCVLHVVSPVPAVPMGAEPSGFNVSLYEHELETSSKRSLEEIVHQMEWKDLKVRLIVLRGSAADEIVRVAEEENADLIVIATRGRTGLDRLIFGSVAEKVVRLARCPVLTVSAGPSGAHGQGKEGDSTMEETELKSTDQKLENKRAYQEKIEAQLKEWGVRIDVLKAKAERSKAEVKTAYLKQIEELKRKQQTIKQKLREFQGSGDEAWEDFKGGVEDAVKDLKRALQRATSRFKKP